jgi:hypothetical protein
MNTQIKKQELKRNFLIFLALLLLFLCLFSFYPSKLQANELITENNSDPSAPLLIIESPVSGETINNKSVLFTGVVSDDVSLAENLTLLLYEEPDISKSIAVDSNGIWSTTIELSQGEHTIYVKATDESGVFTTTSVTFTVIHTTSEEPSLSMLETEVVDIKVVKEVKITNNDSISRDLLLTTNSTRVKLDTSIVMKVSDSAISNIYTGKTDGDPITVFKKIDNENRLERVPGTTVYDPENRQFVFTPMLVGTEPGLLPSTAYYVYINRAWMDTTISAPEETGFSFYPKFLKFTTVSESSHSPHGNYKPNTNLCKNCHNTHASSKTGLEEPNFNEMNDIDLLSNNYCMACHDGTVAPLPENINDTHKHGASVSSDLPSASSCTSCHDPHLTWSGENPSLFKNHYVYQHNVDNKDVTTTEPIDSDKEACETCHDDASLMKASVRENSYKVFHYRKATVASGKSEDFALCLRCHNGETKDKNDVAISNIQEYYQDYNPTDPNKSMHWITQNDGSSLNGNIPCAECHDTHGSNNIMTLKDKLGHENQQNFSATSGDWDATKERDFCVKCHNGETAIYGVIGSAIFDKTSKEAINPTNTAHDEASTQACSECHSNNNSFSEAAHAPKRVQ